MISSFAIGQDFITKDFIVPTKPKTHKAIPPSECKISQVKTINYRFNFSILGPINEGKINSLGNHLRL